MRLITWNCKGAFHRKHDYVAALRPDILIVPECEKIAGVTQPFNCAPVRSIGWFGSNTRKGLAVLSYGDYTFDVHHCYDSRHQWIIPLTVTGPVTFVLFAVWTLPLRRLESRYVRPLLEAFEFYKPVLDSTEVVWAGDFNSSYIFDKPSRKYKFRDFVSQLAHCGLHSLYHQQRDCAHGAELEDTFYLYHHKEKGYHIDYVFAADSFHPHGVEVSVGSHEEWSKRSDHAPLICDFRDHAGVA